MELRPEVRAFAEAMEDRLRANDHKTGWKGEDWDWLLMRLGQEVAELRLCLMTDSWQTTNDIRHEAADVANFAMMIADVCGCLASSPES